MKHNNYRRIHSIAYLHPYSIKKYRLKLNRHDCPKCKKYMLRYKWDKKYWWRCSNHHCSFNAPDARGMPKLLTNKQSKDLYFINQLEYILFMSHLDSDLRANILVRLIKRKNLDGLPQKFILMYHRLIEPIRKSISFAPCGACNNVLNRNDSGESLHVGDGEYLCRICYGY
ncbi:TPA: hypothetical protein JA969_12085 [Legionella pneumophila]|nr:hypothetical protein [Legionella pneumophila]HAT8583758.1 hypothetical protein [Legionella pneumophila]